MGRRRKTQGAVSASALSQMGVCERLVVFEHHEGKRSTPAQKAALRRGQHAHRRFAAEGLSDVPRTGRCFIATQIFGEGLETQVLRRFRDRVLRPTRAGRRVIRGYYQVAPSVCRILTRWPLLRCVARVVLRPVVWFTMRSLGAPKASRVD